MVGKKAWVILELKTTSNPPMSWEGPHFRFAEGIVGWPAGRSVGEESHCAGKWTVEIGEDLTLEYKLWFPEPQFCGLQRFAILSLLYEFQALQTYFFFFFLHIVFLKFIWISDACCFGWSWDSFQVKLFSSLTEYELMETSEVPDNFIRTPESQGASFPSSLSTFQPLLLRTVHH